MRIIFAGTPEFAAAHLKALLTQTEHQIAAVYTQPDRRAGRGKKLHSSPVKQIAEQAGLTICQPVSLKNADDQATLAQHNADVMVVAAYGLILPQAVLDTPKFGCINIHASLLPRWRGAAPIERAIIAGDSSTGITIMQMDKGLDTGAMLLKASCSIEMTETGDSLRAKMINLGVPLLLKTLKNIANETLTTEQQDDTDSTYANKIEKSEAVIDWHVTALAIDQKIRAFTSALACHSFLNEQRVRIVETQVDPSSAKAAMIEIAPGTITAINKNHITVQCLDSSLNILSVQLPGSKVMTIAALLNGRADFFSLGNRFTAPMIDPANR